MIVFRWTLVPENLCRFHNLVTLLESTCISSFIIKTNMIITSCTDKHYDCLLCYDD
jgi:hypothetical protein